MTPPSARDPPRYLTVAARVHACKIYGVGDASVTALATSRSASPPAPSPPSWGRPGRGSDAIHCLAGLDPLPLAAFIGDADLAGLSDAAHRLRRDRLGFVSRRSTSSPR